MPYIGTSPSNGVRRKHTYTATASQTSFSGAGAEGATLSYNDSNFVDVYQNGVKLSEADYTSTSGTAIVLAQGASVSDIVEVVVYDVFSVADTVSKADGGTFDGNITAAGTLGVTGASTLTGALSAKGGAVFNEDSADVDFRVESNDNTHGIFLDAGAGLVGIGNSNPDGHYNLADDLVIGNGSGGRGLTIYSGNDSSGYIGFNDSEADSMRAYIQYGHNDDTFRIGVAGESHFAINSAHILTMDKQPAFFAYASSTQSNIAVGSDVTVVFGTEVFDQNADFASNTFTAPVTGRYQLQTAVRIQDAMTASLYYYLQLVTSNRAYLGYIINTAAFDQDVNYLTLNISVLADMDASDTAFVKIVQHSGNQQTDVYGGAEYSTYFSGYLVA